MASFAAIRGCWPLVPETSPLPPSLPPPSTTAPRRRPPPAILTTQPNALRVLSQHPTGSKIPPWNPPRAPSPPFASHGALGGRVPPPNRALGLTLPHPSSVLSSPHPPSHIGLRTTPLSSFTNTGPAASPSPTAADLRPWIMVNPASHRTWILTAATRALAASLAAVLIFCGAPSSAARAGALDLVMDGETVEVEKYVRGRWRPDISPEEARAISGMGDEGTESSLEPQQAHVSLWGPGRVVVSWITTDPEAPSVVEYGSSPGEYASKAYGTGQTYSYLMYRSNLIHTAVLGSEESPLLPNTYYYYRCSGGERELSFKTPPASFPLNVAVVGDLGQTGWSVSTLEHIDQQPYDFLVLPGDLSYADRYQPRWDSWGMLVEPLASSRPWMVVPGNHEIEGIPLLEAKLFKAYSARWPIPHSVGPTPSPSNLFYSFETAGVHWLMLASYDNFLPGSEQYKWLEADLASVDRSRTPWLVAVLHAPWYNSNFAHQGDGESMREALERLLYEAGTDLLFAGHVHAYERSARVYDNKLDPCGIVHITIGDGGNREGLEPSYFRQPEWSLRREASFGHGELQFHRDGFAEWLWHRNQDDESVVADYAKIYSHAIPLLQHQQGTEEQSDGGQLCFVSQNHAPK